MAILPFGPYLPDLSDYEGAHTQSLLNVVARGDGYGPFADLSAFTSALPAACRGIFYARKNDGTISIFAGTSTKLYNLNNVTGAWVDVSAGAGSYTTLASNANWQFVQFNKYVIATQVNDDVQVFDLTSSTEFADLAGSPPRAAYIAVVNRFLVLSGIASPNVYRIQWSGLDATTTWTSGISQSDFQDLADGGIVRGVAGGEQGIIFQDSAIRRMSYSPGSPYIFGIERIATDDGLFAPYSLINAADRLFYLSPQGFKMLLPGGYPIPIGKEKVDRTFFADADVSNPQLILGAFDPQSTRVFWAYKSLNGSTGLFDKILSYDFVLERWTPIMQAGEYLASVAQPGLTLEGVNSAFGTNIDTIALGSFDDIPLSNGAFARLSGVTSDNKLGLFTGSNKEATLITSEHGGDKNRIFIRGYRPDTDAPTVYGSVSKRENIQDDATYSSEVLMNSIGNVNSRVSTRYARGKMRIPAGTEWTFAAGAEPDATLEGEK